jgi:hypothetical protein
VILDKLIVSDFFLKNSTTSVSVYRRLQWISTNFICGYCNTYSSRSHLTLVSHERGESEEKRERGKEGKRERGKEEKRKRGKRIRKREPVSYQMI